MTINVETDHPHGVAHVALFTCQPRPVGQSFSSISVQQVLVRTHCGRHHDCPHRPHPHTRHRDVLSARVRSAWTPLRPWPSAAASTSSASRSRQTGLERLRRPGVDQPPDPRSVLPNIRAPRSQSGESVDLAVFLSAKPPSADADAAPHRHRTEADAPWHTWPNTTFKKARQMPAPQPVIPD
jgi:hypothetical protein